MNIPENLKYTKNHEWVLLEKETASIGVTDFAQQELGDIVYLDVDTVNEDIDSNEVFGTIEAVKTVSDLYMPLTGKIVEFNSNLEEKPELLNQDPYGKGWIIKVLVKDINEVEELLTPEQYFKLLNG